MKNLRSIFLPAGRKLGSAARAAVMLAAVAILVQPLQAAAAAPPRPNIIVILVDDMGFSIQPASGERGAEGTSQLR